MPLSAAMTLVEHEVALRLPGREIRLPKAGQRLPSPGRPGERRGLAQSCLWAALQYSYCGLGRALSLCQMSGLGAPGYRPFTSYASYLMPVRLAGAPGAR